MSVSHRTHRRATKSLLVALVGLVSTLGVVGTAAASIAPRSHPATSVAAVVKSIQLPATSNFCQNAAKSIDASTPSSDEAFGTKTLAADYATFKADEAKVISVAPSQIKGDFQGLFTWSLNFWKKLASVNYNFTKLPTSFLTQLASSESKIQPDIKAIDSYVEKNCGITIPSAGAAG